ncbi:MAG TPA: glutamine-hydrolyzing GMP synthase, partial [Candidatus Kapabacteria bacterium]|nr:glutamine-hydrolyzing GMP synthase [Candidatus Kapabacteria bacterium]
MQAISFFAMTAHKELIVILDYGAQYTQLIARKVRECGVYAEIYPFNISPEKLRALQPKGIILSGGPSSVYAPDAPRSDKEIFSLNLPVLGICYGLQFIAWALGGEVDKAAKKEFGRAELTITKENKLLPADKQFTVWMSHGDSLTKLPPGFEVIAKTENAPIGAIQNVEKNIYGVQFHPEVHHTPRGKEILHNFLYNICGCVGGWSAESFIETKVKEIRETVGSANVICALSGGVDSSVAAVLIHKAIGKQLKCIHIDNGL